MFKSGLDAVRDSLTARSLSPILATALSLSCLLLAPVAAMADEEGEWSVTLIKHANKAIEAYNRGDWATAKTEFRTCIGLNPKDEEFYDGLMNSCLKTNEWDQVAFAAQKIAEMDPGRKGEVAFFAGMAMYRLNRFDEAIPWLKQAIASNDKGMQPFHPTAKDEGLAAASHPSAPAPPPLVKPDYSVVAVKAKDVLNKQEYLEYETALTHSEGIILATYEGVDRGDFHWNNPPTSHWHREKILKGPPMNQEVPVRFEFHDAVNPAMPAGWKWVEKAVMPEKGSSWILFFEGAYARSGAWDTYQGSYGRQPATDENLNKLYALLDKYNMRNANIR
jgi:hypothetical protein